MILLTDNTCMHFTSIACTKHQLNLLLEYTEWTVR